MGTTCGQSAGGTPPGASKPKSSRPSTIATKCAAAPTSTGPTGPRDGTATCGRGPASAAATTERPTRRRRKFARAMAGGSAARRSCTRIAGRILDAGTITTSSGPQLREGEGGGNLQSFFVFHLVFYV